MAWIKGRFPGEPVWAFGLLVSVLLIFLAGLILPWGLWSVFSWETRFDPLAQGLWLWLGLSWGLFILGLLSLAFLAGLGKGEERDDSVV